jgi:pyroglutamyl-peptidase
MEPVDIGAGDGDRRGVTRVLLTGFDPFGRIGRNPSGEIAAALDGETVAGAAVLGLVLPTAYDASVRRLAEAIRDAAPDVIVMLGVAEGRSAIGAERVAINLDAASIADNDGDLRTDRPIDDGGPAACFSRLPVGAMVDAITAAGLPAAMSLSAGAFVCNHLFYSAMAMTAGTPVRAGFIHVPALPGTVSDDKPSMPFEDMIRGIRVAIEAAVTA